jgi:AcrR family transcriptional regulator
MMNAEPHNVRVSDLSPAGPVRARDDRRVRRTRQALVLALIDLTREKQYERLTVQDLLDRADIGRSTFYTHYRGKDDLLIRSFERLLEALDASMDGSAGTAERVAPVRELFAHVGASRDFHRTLARARMLDRVYQAGIACLTTTIIRRLRGRGASHPGQAERDKLAARAAAGALFALLRWWLDHDPLYTPDQMDAMFHAFVLPGLSGSMT